MPPGREEGPVRMTGRPAGLSAAPPALPPSQAPSRADPGQTPRSTAGQREDGVHAQGAAGRRRGRRARRGASTWGKWQGEGQARGCSPARLFCLAVHSPHISSSCPSTPTARPPQDRVLSFGNVELLNAKEGDDKNAAEMAVARG
jgi:hypothetical protein